MTIWFPLQVSCCHDTCLRTIRRSSSTTSNSIESGAAFVCAALDLALKPREDHADYIANCLTVLKNDNRAVSTPASHA